MSIGPEEARKLALDYYVADVRRRAEEHWHEAKVLDGPPGTIYLATNEPVWFVYVPLEVDAPERPMMLRSGTVVVISRETGRLVTVTSANDEG